MDPNVTLPAGEWVNFGPGNYLAFLDGSDTIEIEFFHRNGRLDDSVQYARPGYWQRLPERDPGGIGHPVGFTHARVRSQTQQTATIVVLSGEGGERRLTGVVNVVDSAKSRTENEQAFIGSARNGAVSGEYSALQLLNPAGSGKNAYINQMILGADAATAINMKWLNTPLAGATSPLNPNSKKQGGVSSVLEMRTETLASTPGASADDLGGITVQASDSRIWEYKEPLMLAPGEGVVWYGGTNAECQVVAEFFEEDV